MPYFVAKAVIIAAILGAGAALASCAESRLRLAPDFGESVRQDVAAQVADPDAHYAGVPAPGSNGMRTSLAQQRYDRDHVATPASTSVATSTGGGDGGGGGGGGGGGMAGVSGAP
jgi:hypothetical protein